VNSLNAKGGAKLFDMQTEPKQFANLVDNPEQAARVAEFRKKLAAKLTAVRTNDL
jgi:iduronate 2-sulfatase